MKIMIISYVSQKENEIVTDVYYDVSDDVISAKLKDTEWKTQNTIYARDFVEVLVYEVKKPLIHRIFDVKHKVT